MNQKAIRILAAITIGLVLLVFALQMGEQGRSGQAGDLLLPDFKPVANKVDRVEFYNSDEADPITIQLDNDMWVIANRGNYSADIGKLRQLIVQLADAQILEEKTSNPENYGKLGVDDPQNGGKGDKVVVNGDDFSYAVILGNTAQGSFRYARLENEKPSYLIDQNPKLPTAAGEWLSPDIVDIAADKIKRLVIKHAGNETIVIERTDQEQGNFVVAGVPAGRELANSTVGNSVAGALANLVLEDVQPATDADVETTTVFETWDGLTLTAQVATDDEDISWVTLTAEASGENADAGNQAAKINKRVSGWRYELADYKKGLLTRRWSDLLKPSE